MIPTPRCRCASASSSSRSRQLITVHDAVVVSWPDDKKQPRTHQLVSSTGTATAGGAFWGLLLGVIFFIPLIGLAFGAAMGALSGSLTDFGIDDDFVKDVRRTRHTGHVGALPALERCDPRPDPSRARRHVRGADRDQPRRRRRDGPHGTVRGLIHPICSPLAGTSDIVPRFSFRSHSLTNISLATRLSVVALMVTLVSLAITAAVGLKRGGDLADGVADDRLVTVSASRTSEIEIELRAIAREIEALADSPATADSIESLGDAVVDLGSTPVQGDEVDGLTEFYLTDVVPELERVRGTRVGASFLVPDSSRAIHLQSAYTVPKTDADGVTIDPDLVLDPGDGSVYSEFHPDVHQTYGQIALASGFDDLFLIDARSDWIVYSMRKRIEFGTSLDVGPHSGSALARLVDTLDDGSGAAMFSDFSSYVPAHERPTLFVGSAVLRDGVRVGYLVASLDVAAVDAIVSGNGKWEGFGDTGEAFLVADDGVMRTTTRTYQQDPGGVPGPRHRARPGPAERRPTTTDRRDGNDVDGPAGRPPADRGRRRPRLRRCGQLPGRGRPRRLPSGVRAGRRVDARRRGRQVRARQPGRGIRPRHALHDRAVHRRRHVRRRPLERSSRRADPSHRSPLAECPDRGRR